MPQNSLNRFVAPENLEILGVELGVDIPDQPLDLAELGGYKPTSFPQIPTEMVDSIAIGMEDDLIVAARHGFSVEDYRRISCLKSFQVSVASRRAEFEKNGLTTKLKSSMLAGMALDKLAILALAEGASFAQVHEALKTFARLGGLEPKEDKGIPLANLPTIVINAGGVTLTPHVHAANAASSLPLVDIVPPELASPT